MKMMRGQDHAYRIGVGVGQDYADMLRIEIVAAVYTRTVDALDEACRVKCPHTECGTFSGDFENGWWDGMRSRCSDIIERLNNKYQ